MKPWQVKIYVMISRIQKLHVNSNVHMFDRIILFLKGKHKKSVILEIQDDVYNDVSQSISYKKYSTGDSKSSREGFLSFLWLKEKQKTEYMQTNFDTVKLSLKQQNSAEALGNKPHRLCSYSQGPRSDVYCLRLDFNISKLVYFKHNTFVRFVRLVLSQNCCPFQTHYIE